MFAPIRGPKRYAYWSGFRNSVSAVHCIAIFSFADARKRVPPRGEHTGGSRFRATLWKGNFREATEESNPLQYHVKFILSHVLGRAASPFAAECLASAWKALCFPSCRDHFARRAGDCPPYPQPIKRECFDFMLLKFMDISFASVRDKGVRSPTPFREGKKNFARSDRFSPQIWPPSLGPETPKTGRRFKIRKNRNNSKPRLKPG